MGCDERVHITQHSPHIPFAFTLHSHCIHTTWMLCECNVNVIFTLHSHYIPITFTLHSHYIHITLHSPHIRFTFALHSRCIHTTFTLHSHHVHSTSRLHSHCIPIAFALRSPCICIAGKFCHGKTAGHYGHPKSPVCFVQCDQVQQAFVRECAHGTSWKSKVDKEPAKSNMCM